MVRVISEVKKEWLRPAAVRMTGTKVVPAVSRNLPLPPPPVLQSKLEAPELTESKVSSTSQEPPPSYSSLSVPAEGPVGR